MTGKKAAKQRKALEAAAPCPGLLGGTQDPTAHAHQVKPKFGHLAPLRGAQAAAPGCGCGLSPQYSYAVALRYSGLVHRSSRSLSVTISESEASQRFLWRPWRQRCADFVMVLLCRQMRRCHAAKFQHQPETAY